MHADLNELLTTDVTHKIHTITHPGKFSTSPKKTHTQTKLMDSSYQCSTHKLISYACAF